MLAEAVHLELTFHFFLECTEPQTTVINLTPRAGDLSAKKRTHDPAGRMISIGHEHNRIQSGCTWYSCMVGWLEHLECSW